MDKGKPEQYDLTFVFSDNSTILKILCDYCPIFRQNYISEAISQYNIALSYAV